MTAVLLQCYWPPSLPHHVRAPVCTRSHNAELGTQPPPYLVDPPAHAVVRRGQLQQPLQQPVRPLHAACVQEPAGSAARGRLRHWRCCAVLCCTQKGAGAGGSKPPEWPEGENASRQCRPGPRALYHFSPTQVLLLATVCPPPPIDQASKGLAGREAPKSGARVGHYRQTQQGKPEMHVKRVPPSWICGCRPGLT
jgi:hypothetical protein